MCDRSAGHDVPTGATSVGHPTDVLRGWLTFKTPLLDGLRISRWHACRGTGGRKDSRTAPHIGDLPLGGEPSEFAPRFPLLQMITMKVQEIIDEQLILCI